MTPRPRPKPRILISVDQSSLHLFGLTYFTYQHLLRKSGAVSLGTLPRYRFSRVPMLTQARQLARRADGLLLTGGGDVDPTLYGSREPARHVRPWRDRFELELIKIALTREIPILGICRGCQLLNVADGGSLRTIRDDSERRRYHHRMRKHPVKISSNSRLAEIVGRNRIRGVRSLHGQVVDRPGKSLHIVAHADDDLPEAIESTAFERRWTVGVQWHPELSWSTTEEHRLVDAFVAQAARMR